MARAFTAHIHFQREGDIIHFGLGRLDEMLRGSSDQDVILSRLRVSIYSRGEFNNKKISIL